MLISYHANWKICLFCYQQCYGWWYIHSPNLKPLKWLPYGTMVCVTAIVHGWVPIATSCHATKIFLKGIQWARCASKYDMFVIIRTCLTMASNLLNYVFVAYKMYWILHRWIPFSIANQPSSPQSYDLFILISNNIRILATTLMMVLPFLP